MKFLVKKIKKILLPSKEVKDQYYKALKLEEDMENATKNIKDKKKTAVDILNDFADKLSSKLVIDKDSSGPNNVIEFPKDKLH